jgi:uncharacterized membrane protein YjdF
VVRLRASDGFAAAATLMFLVFAAVMHHDFWVHSGGTANRTEFFIYAFVAAIGIWIGWLYFRRYPLPPWVLAAIAAALLLHFAGGFVHYDGRRLYDLVFAGVRFDKLVHFVNAAITAQIVAEFLRVEGVALRRLRVPVIVLVVLGIGSVVEIVEYSVVRLIPDAGVGFYHNTMLDLISNFLGAATSTLVLPARDRASLGPQPERGGSS